MPEFNIILPSKPAVIAETETAGTYEIEGLYPGYGHTLGNSLRRIVLSSLPGFAITSIKVDGVPHEFSTIEGVKEDVITIILNLKKVRFKVVGDESQIVTLSIKGPKEVTAGDLKTPGQVEVVNKDEHLVSITGKGTQLELELTLEKGLGYVPKEALHKDKVEIGRIAVDAVFTPIRRVSYEVEQMRVGNRTDYNRLRMNLETDGVVTPRTALEQSIEIMINQLKAIIGFKEEVLPQAMSNDSSDDLGNDESDLKKDSDILKTRIDDLNLSVRTMKALSAASIRTVGGLTRKKEDDLLALSGLGEKGVQEIKRALSNYGIVLK